MPSTRLDHAHLGKAMGRHLGACLSSRKREAARERRSDSLLCVISAQEEGPASVAELPCPRKSAPLLFHQQHVGATLPISSGLLFHQQHVGATLPISSDQTKATPETCPFSHSIASRLAALKRPRDPACVRRSVKPRYLSAHVLSLRGATGT